MYKQQEMTAKEEFRFDSAVSRSIHKLVGWIRLEIPNWIEDRFIHGTKPITRSELNALFEAERILLEDFIKKGDTDNLYKLINLFYDPMKSFNDETLEKRSKKLQKKEFDLYTKAISEQIESIALYKKSDPEVLKGIMKRLFKDFEDADQWNETMRVLDDPLEEYLVRRQVNEAELLGQDGQAEYLTEAQTGVPFQ